MCVCYVFNKMAVLWIYVSSSYTYLLIYQPLPVIYLRVCIMYVSLFMFGFTIAD